MGGGVESDYSVCPRPLLQFFQFLQFCQFKLVGLCQVTSNYVSLRWRDRTWSSTKILFLLSNCVSTRFGLRQPCFNLEKHNWCWATLFPPDLDLSNLVSSWKSTIYDEQPCFHLIWPWVTLFHLGKAQMIEQPCFNLIWTWVILFHLGKAKLILSNLVSTWFVLEQPCFIIQKHHWCWATLFHLGKV